MSELTGPVQELIGSTGEVAQQSVINQGAIRESAGRFAVMHENIGNVERFLNELGTNMRAIEHALAAENEHGEQTAAAEQGHAERLKEILGLAENILTGTDNEHAGQALASLRDASNEATSAADIYKQAREKTERLNKYVANISKGFTIITTNVALIHATSQEASVSANQAADDVEAAGAHSDAAKAELETYQQEMR